MYDIIYWHDQFFGQRQGILWVKLNFFGTDNLEQFPY